MHYNLLFNGCSWTYGGELEGIHEDREYQRNHRFSHLVAKNLGMTYDNISKAGISNDWIVEKTIEWFNKGNTCDVAVIQFTSASRTIWYDEDDKNKEYSFTAFLSRNDGTNCPNHITLKSSLYYKTFYSNMLGQQNLYKNIFLLENYFASNNIKFVFITIDVNHNSKSNWKNFCKTQSIENMRYLLGIKNNHGFDYLYNENYCLDRKRLFFGGGHPSEKGHKIIANYLIKELNNASFI